MSKKALFPGSFDPFTRGHEAVVKNALKLFDEVIIGIGVNSSKSYLFPLEKRSAHIEDVFKGEKRIKVMTFEGLTVEFCKDQGIEFIVRGLRNTRDFEYEYQIANMNRGLNNEVETIFIATLPEHTAINSTIVREVYKNGGDIKGFLPEGIPFP